MEDQDTQSRGDEYIVNHNREPIGRGSFGEVKIGRTKDGRQLAVKVAQSPDKIKAAKVEIQFLNEFVNEDNIVQLIGFQETKDRMGNHPPLLTFAMELAECSLDKLMREGANIRGLPQNVLIDLVMDCCSAINSLRKKKVAHRDIKHLNILVFRCKQRKRKSTYLFKLCDLGNATEMNDDYGMNSLVGTPNVLHPKLSHELAKGAMRRWTVDQRYTGDECDFWSLACTLFFAASGRYPFPHNHQDFNVYHQSVFKCPKDCISASIVGVHPIKFRFSNEIESQRYPRWFRVAFSTLIRKLLHEPKLSTYKAIAKALINSKEYTFLSLTQLDVVKYADVSDEELLRTGHPSLQEVLDLPKETDCILFGEDDEIQLSNGSLNSLNEKSSYLVLPATAEIILKPKGWETIPKPETFESKDTKEEFFEVRAAYIGQGFVALQDADKMYTLFDTGKQILYNHIKKLRLKIASAKEAATYPLRFASYGYCQCQAWLVHNDDDKNLALEGMNKSEQATKELTKVSVKFDDAVKELDKKLIWLDQLHLDERELPGMKAELIRYAFCDTLNSGVYEDDVKKSTIYTTNLVQKCYNRRKAIADDFCSLKNDKDMDNIRANMLRALSQIYEMDVELARLKAQVEERTNMIEYPFQLMKTRVETANSKANLTEKDIRRSIAFHNGPHKVASLTAEIKDLAQKLKTLL